MEEIFLATMLVKFWSGRKFDDFFFMFYVRMLGFLDYVVMLDR